MLGGNYLYFFRYLLLAKKFSVLKIRYQIINNKKLFFNFVKFFDFFIFIKFYLVKYTVYNKNILSYFFKNLECAILDTTKTKIF